MPVWLDASEIKLFHRELIDEHGGLAGLRDEGALEAALARPRNLLHYFPESTIYALAASYGFGFAKNHVFIDGNKRLALVAIDVFLQLNGAILVVDEVQAVVVINELAAGTMGEPALAAWITENSAAFDLDAE